MYKRQIAQAGDLLYDCRYCRGYSSVKLSSSWTVLIRNNRLKCTRDKEYAGVLLHELRDRR